eukprot:TRINITY_DN12866_c0_g1_i1.p1 TRINITY_DN12866_c0_g1~~TRINITY_DN12866_c0_g1_i1.p1  ORF type:complete len:521 (-),score=102.91 TRINITY_DN12866_c0_g1_i1:68-1630(-)
MKFNFFCFSSSFSSVLLAHAILVGLLVPEVCASSSSFRAAVVDFSPSKYATHFPLNHSDALEIISQNADAVATLASQAKEYSLDIIVFPEYAFTGPAFAHRNDVSPFLERLPSRLPSCPTNSFSLSSASPRQGTVPPVWGPILHALATAARNNNVTIVADLPEWAPCENNEVEECPPDSHLQFNTAVVVDQNGCLIAAYRKRHLYFEGNVFDAGPTDQPDSVFDSSFGARFALMVCFDVMFMPQYLDDVSIDAYILPSWWVNTSPLISSLQYWQAWTRFWKKNLIVSTAGMGSYASGSGIFSHGIPLAFAFNPSMEPQTKLIFHDIEVPEKKDAFSFQAMKDSMRPSSSSICPPFKIGYSRLHQEVASNGSDVVFSADAFANDLSCHLSGSSLSLDSGTISHALVAVSGMYNGIFCMESCALVQCPHGISHVEQCNPFSRQFDVDAMSFTGIRLEGNFSIDTLLYPEACGEDGVMFPIDQTLLMRNANASVKGMQTSSLHWKQNRVLNFALYGRRFELDP